MYESPRFYLSYKLYALAVLSKSWALLGVSSNAKQSVNGCCFEHWLLEARRFAPHSRRGGAVGTPPSRLSPIPPRFSAVCGFARKVRCFACLWLKLLNRRGFAGASPHTPSLTCDAARAGAGAKSTRPTTCPRAECVLGRCGKGYPKRFIKTMKPSLQIFLDVLPLPW